MLFARPPTRLTMVGVELDSKSDPVLFLATSGPAEVATFWRPRPERPSEPANPDGGGQSQRARKRLRAGGRCYGKDMKFAAKKIYVGLAGPAACAAPRQRGPLSCRVFAYRRRRGEPGVGSASASPDARLVSEEKGSGAPRGSNGRGAPVLRSCEAWRRTLPRAPPAPAPPVRAGRLRLALLAALA